MSVTSTTSTSSSNSATLALLNSKNGAKGDSTLDEGDFLKLLTAQLAAQDPLNPMDDTAFVSQMATFSQLTQMQNIGNDMSVMTASNYIGKTVIAEDSSGKKVTGVVSSVTISDNEPSLVINDTTCALDTVTSVSTTSTSSSSTATE